MPLAVVVVAAGVVWWRWPHDGGESAAAATIGTPKDRLVSFPLNRQPVPGWKLTPADIGLPTGAPVGNLFASTGTTAYFVADHCEQPCAAPMGWVYGLDTRTGARVRPPVALRGFYDGRCYNNGPGIAVCVSRTYRPGKLAPDGPSQVWVIDLRSGAVTFNGPTDLRTGGVGKLLQSIGNYLGESRLVVMVDGEGVYGVGPRAELTWFVPGSGTIFDYNYGQVSEIAPLTIATQGPAPAGGKSNSVFSSADGRNITPAAPSGITLDMAAVYPGGFAYQYSNDSDDKDAGLIFYDVAGRITKRAVIGRAYLMHNSQLPIVYESQHWLVYNATGEQLVDIPAPNRVGNFKAIGTKLYVQPNGEGTFGDKVEWQQWDLLTGQPGPKCLMSLGAGFAASDGQVVISENPDGSNYVAVDPASCQTLWSTSDHSTVYQVGTGLVQVSDFGASVMSLQAAS